jgi:hypothetical protein
MTESEEFEFRLRLERERSQEKPFLNPVGEGVAAVGTGALAAPMSGLVGMAGAVLPGPKGQGAEWARQIQELAYQPKSKGGRDAMAAISYLPEKFAQGADWLGGKVTDLTGSPEHGVAANLAPNAAALMFGRRALTRKPAPASPNLTEAFASGYTLTPTQAGRGIVHKALEGLSGTAKMEKLVSIKNMEVTKRLIKEDFKIPKDKDLTLETLDSIIETSGGAYEAVKSSVKTIKPDAKFKADAQKLRGDFTKAAETYPDLLKNDAVETLISSITVPASPRAMVELTKKLRKDASANLKSFDDPGKRELGLAQRSAATAIENMIDRALLSVGKADLVKNWREARTTIAKAYDVKSALNETTGEISARQLAAMYKKGKPLSGNMEKVARFGRAYEGAAREVSKMLDVTEFSFGDYLAGMLAAGGGMHAFGGPLGAMVGVGASLARPAVRRALIQSAEPTSKLPVLGGGLLLQPLLGIQP